MDKLRADIIQLIISWLNYDNMMNLALTCSYLWKTIQKRKRRLALQFKHSIDFCKYNPYYYMLTENNTDIITTCTATYYGAEDILQWKRDHNLFNTEGHITGLIQRRSPLALNMTYGAGIHSFMRTSLSFHNIKVFKHIVTMDRICNIQLINEAIVYNYPEAIAYIITVVQHIYNTQLSSIHLPALVPYLDFSVLFKTINGQRYDDKHICTLIPYYNTDEVIEEISTKYNSFRILSCFYKFHKSQINLQTLIDHQPQNIICILRILFCQDNYLKAIIKKNSIKLILSIEKYTDRATNYINISYKINAPVKICTVLCEHLTYNNYFFI